MKWWLLLQGESTPIRYENRTPVVLLLSRRGRGALVVESREFPLFPRRTNGSQGRERSHQGG